MPTLSLNYKTDNSDITIQVTQGDRKNAGGQSLKSKTREPACVYSNTVLTQLLQVSCCAMWCSTDQPFIRCATQNGRKTGAERPEKLSSNPELAELLLQATQSADTPPRTLLLQLF